MRPSHLASSARGAVLAAAILALAAPVQAVQHPNNCNFQCTADCELDQDITCVTDAGIQLFNGADLDLKGHRILCDNPGDIEGICTGHAIVMFAGNSTVRDTGSPKGGVFGFFATAIDCGHFSSNVVTGITLQDIDGNAIRDCGTVDSNIIISRTQLDYVDRPAVDSSNLAMTVRNNYIANFGFAINTGVSSKAETIDGNVIEAQAPLGGAGFSLVAPKAIATSGNTSTATKVTNNTILGPAGQVVLNAATIASNNRCDATSADCQACIASHACTDPAVPYLLDRSVSLRPSANGDANQFALLDPSNGITSANKWVLLSDAPDGDSTGYFRTMIGDATVNATKVELYHVDDLSGGLPAGEEYQSCVLEARMAGLNVPTHLIVKLQGVQSDGPTINVNSGGPQLYTRVMTGNPFVALTKWTSDVLLDSTLEIGVKTDPSPTGGVTVGDLILRCK